MAMLDYLRQKLAENPSFFYEMQFDDEHKITNIFWADARSIMDYHYFGDVVGFDTTYRTNVEARPDKLFFLVLLCCVMKLF